MKRYTCVLGSGVQLFGIVVIDILLMQSIRMVLEVHLWLGLRTLFWLRVSLYLKYLLRSSVCCLLESAPSSLWTIWLRPISSVEKSMFCLQRCIFVLRLYKV